MNDKSSLMENQTCQHRLNLLPRQLHSCERCERAQKFQQLLNHLAVASKAEDYEEKISTMVAMISAVCA